MVLSTRPGSGTQGHYPFGEWYATGDTSKFRFTSYERDPAPGESGNDYAIARYYINRFGRFNSPDPIEGFPADPQSWNRFAYARNDPVNLTDPQTLNRYAYVRNDPINLVDPRGLWGSAMCTGGGFLSPRSRPLVSKKDWGLLQLNSVKGVSRRDGLERGRNGVRVKKCTPTHTDSGSHDYAWQLR